MLDTSHDKVIVRRTRCLRHPLDLNVGFFVAFQMKFTLKFLYELIDVVLWNNLPCNPIERPRTHVKFFPKVTDRRVHLVRYICGFCSILNQFHIKHKFVCDVLFGSILAIFCVMTRSTTGILVQFCGSAHRIEHII